MNKDIKQKWVDALRSGKYKQTFFQFYDGVDAYCGLGVLCKVLGEEPLYSSYSSHIFAILNVMPSETMKKVASLNDVSLKKFDEIADWIDENIESE